MGNDDIGSRLGHLRCIFCVENIGCGEQVDIAGHFCTGDIGLEAGCIENTDIDNKGFVPFFFYASFYVFIRKEEKIADCSH